MLPWTHREFSGLTTIEPPFIPNISVAGSEAEFTFPVGHYFGFYLAPTAILPLGGVWYAENALSSDHTIVALTGNFLLFNTNRGVMLAIDDLPRGSRGRLGNQEYEDLLVGFITKSSGEPIPMPPDRVVPEPSASLYWNDHDPDRLSARQQTRTSLSS